VKRALATVYAESTDSAAAEGDDWVESLRQQGRYKLDVWVTA
jgi:sulfite reductase alpha subunit-like flavoprotein